MTAKTTKPLCVLSDANIIIDAHVLGIWDQLVTQCKMFTTRYIEKNEARYFRSRYGRISINLKKQIQSGYITVLAATGKDTDQLYRTFEKWFLESLDPGEIEALALILAGKTEGAIFCTTDSPAIMALAMLNRASQGISFEKLLERTGFRSLRKKLHYRHSQTFFKQYINKGAQNFVTGTGLIKRLS